MAARTARQQLIEAIPALFPEDSRGFRAKAVMAVSRMPEDVAAGLLRLPEDERQAAIAEAAQGEYVFEARAPLQRPRRAPCVSRLA